MTPTHIFWTANDTSKEALKFAKLSALMAIDLYGYIDLVTDVRGKEIVKTYQIPYRNIYLGLDNIQKQNGFCTAKVEGYKIAIDNIDNFFHLDQDVFLSRKIDNQQHLIQCDEGANSYTNGIYNEAMSRGFNFNFKHRQNDLRYYNMGLFRSTKEVIYRYHQKYNEILKINKHLLVGDFMTERFLVFMEQNIIYIVMKELGIKPHEHYPITKEMHNCYDWGKTVPAEFWEQSKELSAVLKKYHKDNLDTPFDTPANIFAGHITGYTHLVHFKELEETRLDVFKYFQQNYPNHYFEYDHEEVVNEINTIKNNQLKFAPVMGVNLPYAKNQAKFIGEKKLCVVYTCWGYLGYLKYLYISILFQLKHTDIRDYDIRVFVSEALYEKTKALLSPLIGDKIICVPSGLCSKYGVSTHHDLSGFEVLSFCDSDAFLLTKNKNVYQRLYEFHQEKQSAALCFIKKNQFDLDTHEMMEMRFDLTQNKKRLGSFLKNEINKINNYELFEEFLTNNEWPWSCHFSIHNKNMTQKVRSFILACLHRGIFCDETVWFSAMIVSGVKIKTINEEWIHAVTGDKFIEWTEFHQEHLEDLFIHPVQFKERENAPYVRDFINRILYQNEEK